MANVKNYFDGPAGTVDLVGSVHGMGNAEFAAAFPGINGRRYGSFDMLVGYAAGSRAPLPVTRSVTYKRNPSKHECDARCMGAKGRTMNCECSCGGKNHGRGFACISEGVPA